MIKRGQFIKKIKVLSVSAPNNALKIRDAEINGTEGRNRQLHNYGDFSTHLSAIKRSSRQKTNWDIEALNSMNQLDQMHSHKALSSMTVQHMFFSRARGIFHKIDHMPSHKNKL